MKIIHVVHTPRFSGAEMLVASLARIHSKMGHQSQVVSINPASSDFRPIVDEQRTLGIEWIEPLKPLKRHQRSTFIRRVCKSFQPDLVFAHSIIPAAYARLAGVGSVITVLHDSSENDYSGAFSVLSEKLLQYRSAGIIAVSKGAEENYARKFKRPVTRWIPNGIDISAVTRDRSRCIDVRAAMGFGPDDYLAIQIGRFGEMKRQHLSVEAMLPIIQEDPSVHLLLAGIEENYSYVGKLKSLVERANASHNIHFLGARQDIPDLLCGADLFLMPSQREAHSVAMVEALASGIPIVASDIASFSYTENFDGVRLTQVEDAKKYVHAIREFLDERTRFGRTLRGLDIIDTAKAYIEFGGQCIS